MKKIKTFKDRITSLRGQLINVACDNYIRVTKKEKEARLKDLMDELEVAIMKRERERLGG